MAELAAAAEGEPRAGAVRAFALELAAGVGAGLFSALAGAGVGRGLAWLLLLVGQDYASLASVVTRLFAAGLAVGAVIGLGSYDRVRLGPGAGAFAGAAAGTIFGAVSWTGLWWSLALGGLAGAGGSALALSQVPALARRELAAYFYSPVAYVVGTVFLFLFGLFHYLGLLDPRGAAASMANPMWTTAVMFEPVIAPVLTMRLFAEEKRSGTIEVLMTAPVRDWEVVAAKFVAAVATFAMMLVPTLVHVLSLYLVSEKGPAPAPLVGAYLGVGLTGALFIALGLLASSLARDQIVAAIVGFGFSFSVFLLSVVEYMASASGWLAGRESARALFEAMSYFNHLRGFLEGVIRTRSIMYFVALTGFVLFLTVRVVESRKWR